MSVPKHPENPSHSTLCSECQTFYASQTYNGLCSSCFKYHSFNLEKETRQKKYKFLLKSRTKRLYKIQLLKRLLK